ncbi:hypothetical protein PENSTE_c020G00737 [Penicillium steckii]|uniref:Uncharacterized protein n=1 Tax=Penicillium steckii TaxID=303698 RepID=A0A1V6SUH0_9EURO|nr:hypothetical protein PENSTE_c020G00737 [Penicillium steckii]
MSISNDALSKRRRFQPAITSYFSSQQAEPQQPTTVNGNAVSHNHYAAATFSPTPVVPEKVQSSLLSVGMRVRKSVADGYRTEQSLKQEKEKALAPPVAVKPSTAQTQSGSSYSYAELAPFSGISKSYDHIVTDEGDDYSLPPSSQDSIISTDSFHSTNPQKRTFNSDDIFTGWDDESAGFGHGAPAGRHILAPGLGQQRRRMLARQQSSQSHMDLDDFEEAAFLRRREEVDADFARMDYP